MAMSFESLYQAAKDTKIIAGYQYHEYLINKEIDKNAKNIDDWYTNKKA